MRKLFFVLIGFNIVSSVYSQLLKSDSQDIRFEFEVDHVSYSKNLSDKINGRNMIEGNILYRNSFNDHISFKSNFEIRDDYNDHRLRRINFDEAFIDINHKDLNISVGKRKVTWGQADALSIEDIINPIDYYDYLDVEDESIGLMMLYSKYYWKDFCFEGVVVPTFTQSIFPTDDSRWAMDVPEKVSNGYGGYINVGYSNVEKLPENSIQSAQYALKVSGLLKGWDYSFIYYNGFNNIPRISDEVVYADNDSMHVNINFDYYKWQVIGLDFSTALGQFGLRGEAGYFIPEEIKDGDKSYVKYNIGIDKTFSNVIGENNVFTIIQWMQDIAVENQVYSNMDFNHIFQKSLLSRIELQLGNKTEFHLQGIYNFHTDDYYISPGFKFRFYDALNVTLLYDYLNGPDDSFFGYYKENNRFQAKVKYTF